MFTAEELVDATYPQTVIAALAFARTGSSRNPKRGIKIDLGLRWNDQMSVEYFSML